MIAAVRVVREGLASYLGTQLAAAHPTLSASGEWPTPGVALPPEAVTVIAPDRPQTAFYPPVVHSTTPTGSHKGTIVYSFGMVTLGMQIDCWAQFAAKRDVLAEDVSAALNRRVQDTLGIVTLPSLSRRGGLVLRLTDLASALCDYRFEAVPSFQEGSDPAQQGEWRATWQGTAFVHLLATQTDFPILERVILDFGAGGTRVIPWSAP